MRVLVTGATGFVGRWLVRELVATGHQPLGAEERHDVVEASSLRSWVASARADAIVHLAAVSYAPDAAADPAAALAINVGGTLNVIEAVRRVDRPPVVLVVGSSEVYAAPADDSPIDERSRLGPRGLYGLTKLAQESVALAAAQREGLTLAVVRPFNHAGPGQRPPFVVPALARRIAAVRLGAARTIRTGNVDVRRDIGDVRDVVRAYRLLIERLVERPVDDTVFNVATGETIAVRDIIERLAEIAGVEAEIELDPSLVRPDDPPVIRGDATRLRDLVDWRPQVAIEQTLSDVMTEALAERGEEDLAHRARA